MAVKTKWQDAVEVDADVEGLKLKGLGACMQLQALALTRWTSGQLEFRALCGCFNVVRAG